MLETVKKVCREWMTHVSPTMMLFIVAFLVFEVANGVYGKNFDLGALITFAGVILAKDAAVMGINSAWNSPRGEAPAYHPPIRN